MMVESKMILHLLMVKIVMADQQMMKTKMANQEMRKTLQNEGWTEKHDVDYDLILKLYWKYLYFLQMFRIFPTPCLQEF